jgi:hypothetical protein
MPWSAKIAFGCLFVVAVAAIAAAQTSAGNALTGEAKVQMIASYTGAAPLPKPDKILVYNFTVDPDSIAMDDSAAERLHRRRLARRGSDTDSSPEQVAQRVLAAFTDALVGELQKTSVPSAAAFDAYAAVPPQVLTVRGEFTAIDQGNKTKRVMVGFGRGASDVQAHVTVSLTTADQPLLLSEFNLQSESGKKPGAAATMGVGSVATGAAAGSAGDKKASVEADAARMAQAVAKQIQAAMTAQHWTPPPPDAK